MRVLVAVIFFLTFSKSNGQSATDPDQADERWFIVLPLRFTHLQDHNTMLSGVKFGRTVNDRVHASLSVYHSFYLESFKAKAGLNGFIEQPRLFINGVGPELAYYFFRRNRISSAMQILVGWGFLKYDLKAEDFRSKQVNYFAIEPSVNVEYKTYGSTYIGLGIGYRPLPDARQITYSSNISDGEIPVTNKFPNGVNVIFTFRGFL